MKRPASRITKGWFPSAYLLLSVFDFWPASHGVDLVAFGYAVNGGTRPLIRFSAENGQIVQTISTVFRPNGFENDVTDAGLAYGDGALWVLGKSKNYGGRPLQKINVSDGKIEQTIATAFKPEGFGPDISARGLAYGDGYLWGFGEPVNTGASRSLYKLDVKTGKIVETITSSFKTPGIGTAMANIGVAYGDDRLWAFGYPVNNGPRPLYQIYPAKGTVAETIVTAFKPVPLGTDVAPLGLAYNGGSLWAFGYSVNNGARPLYRISPADGKIQQTIPTSFRGGAATDLADLGLAAIVP